MASNRAARRNEEDGLGWEGLLPVKPAGERNDCGQIEGQMSTNLFEAKLLRFWEEDRIRLCEPCLRRAIDDNLVVCSSAIPNVTPDQVVLETARRNSRFRQWLAEQLAAMGSGQG